MNKRRNQAIALLLSGLGALAFAALSTIVNTAPSKSAGQPTVRIGIAEHAAEAEFSCAGRFKILGAGEKRLWEGAARKVQVTIDKPDAGVDAGYYVLVGAYRSNETAVYVGENIRRKFQYGYSAAHPDDWYVRLGPYSLLQAAGVWSELREDGMLNIDIAPAKPVASYRVEVITDAGEKTVYSGVDPVVFDAESDRWKFGANTYRGRMSILPDTYGALSVINLVGADDYLRGVVASEMPASAEMESLKAQAVIARTYLMHGLDRHSADGFNLCGNPDCQVYKGTGGETERTDRAVAETAGMVLYSGGEMANPLFHSTCGGRTAAYGEVWPGVGDESLVSADDGTGKADLSSETAFRAFLKKLSGNCAKSKYYRWEVVRTHDEMERVLQEKLPALLGKKGLIVGALKEITIENRQKSGRLGEIVISTASGDYRFRKDEIRWALGGMKSTLFTFDVKKDGGGVKYVFTGAGWGHGAGLCQIGAMELGRRTWKFDRILAHYYPGAEMRRDWR